jgi:hypothetical protein
MPLDYGNPATHVRPYISVWSLQQSSRTNKQDIVLGRGSVGPGVPVTQVQVLTSFLNAEKTKPRCGVRQELYAFHESRPDCARTAPGDLRS